MKSIGLPPAPKGVFCAALFGVGACIFFLLIFSFNCLAQVTVTNRGVSITNLNQPIYVNADVVNETSGMIHNAGNIYLSGNISNNSNTSFCDSSAGTIYLSGSNPLISGTHALNFHRLVLNTPDTLLLQQSIKVTDSLRFDSGCIKLNGNSIDLDSTGILSKERNSSRIFGTSGKITFRKYMSNPALINNIAGMGLKLQSSGNHGLVTIERSHSRQPAADTSIFRSYKVSSQYPGIIDSISIAYFSDEKFGNENNYRVFSKKVSGNNGWTNKGGAVDFVGKGVASHLKLLLDTTLLTIADQICASVPDVHVTGISTLVPLMSVDTITCAKDTLSVLAYSSAPNSLVSWRDISDSIYSNPLQVSSPGFYFIDVANGINGCANNILVNITQDKTPPLLNPLSDSAFLNCSQNSIQLNASAITGQTQLNWSGPGAFTSADPATVSTMGYYHLTGTASANGCTSIDSVYVGYKPLLVLQSSNDTLICKGSVVTLHTVEIGSLSGVNYLWSTGASSQNTSVSPIATSTYIVTANSPGCSGKDTVLVTVAPDLTDSVETFLSCNGTQTGTILLHSFGGIPPYSFSIDNGTTYFSTGNFNNIPFGNYSVLIKDSLGCTVSGSATLSGSTILPIPKFIASTQNAKGDTIVLVDISSPQPDSVSWIFPPQAIKIGGDMFSPMIYMSDTGAFLVTMTGYWSDCIIDTTKLIYFHVVDTTLASEYNNNGIKSITLFPNPNSGTFTVGVEFYKKQNSSIQIWDTSPTKYFQKNYSGTDLITLPVTLPQLVNGTYILRVIGEYNTKYLNFVVSH